MAQLALLSLVITGTIELAALAAIVPPPVLDALAITDESGYILDLSRFRSDPYLAAAVQLQESGRELTGKFLLQLSRDRRRSQSAIILSRMLFTAKRNGEFRAPALGLPAFFGDTSFENWPLRPITVVDGVPFVVTWGYALAGSPEPAGKYVRYCLRECDWGTTGFKPKTAEEKQKALEKLLESRTWKKPPTAYEKEFLSAQIK